MGLGLTPTPPLEVVTKHVMVKELDKEKLDKAFDELAIATWRLYSSMRKVGFSRKESYGIARDWFLACVHQAHQQSSIVSSLLQNIHIPTKPI